MNNKKIQAQMQIDVSFLSKGLSLTKDIQSQLDRVKFTGPLTKHFTDDLSKQFKAIETNYNKMISGLSKKGLNSKQYTAIFEEGNLAIRKNIESIRDVGKAIKEAYNSKEQKDLLKGLEAQKQLLQDIKKLQSSMKQSNAAGVRATGKLKDEFGLDFGNSEVRNALKAVKERRGAGKTSLTPTQKTVLGTDDETKIKRIITLYDQIITALDKVKVKQAEINGVGGVEGIEKRIALLEKNVITEENLAEVNQLLAKINSQSLVPSLETFDKILNRSASDAEKAAKASQSFKEVLAQFGIVFSAASLARGVRDLIKGSFDFYKSLDSALNEIYVVSNLTSKEVDGLKNNFINMAKETGMALDDVTRSAVLFYQQGLNTQEVMTMTEVTAQFAKVAGIDATDAADKLTAAVNGYCLSAENAAEVADKFNKVAAVSAADINELSTAFSKAAAQANQAGVSMDNYLAYIATMEEATREAPENLGTSLKTIFSRMQQIKTGENTEDNVDVNAVETALRSVGIQLRDTEGQLRDLEEIFDELGPKWNSLNRNTQAYLGTIIAGTRQQSRFITLMQNWSRVQDLAAESENSAGQQALMHAKAMESIESKLNQLTVAWQEFVSNLTSSSTFKTVIDLMKGFLNLINGGAKPVMLLTTSIGLFANKLKDLQSPLAKKAGELKGLFGKGKTLLTYDEKKSKLKENADARKELEDTIALNAEKMRQLVLEGKATEQETQELVAQNEIHQQNLSQLEKEKAVIESTNTDLDKKAAKWKAIGGIVTTIGLAAGQQDETLGGILTGAGVAATGVGQIMSGNYIGGAVSLITGGIQFFKAFGDAAENAKRKMVDAIEKVKKDTDELVNKGTQSRELKRLIDRYQELNNKTYRTKQEQEELNEVIQAMGDSQGVEVLTDEFGNLSISIDKVIEKYDELLEKQKKLLDEVQASEQKQLDKATSGIMNNNTASQYIDKLYSELKSDYRNLLTGIQDLSIDGVREVSKSTYEKLNIALKDSIQTIIGQDKSANFYNGGFAKSTVDLQNSLNQKLQQENGWDYVYSQVDKLQKQVDSLSWDEFNGSMESMFSKWREELKLTETEYQVLQRSIAMTLYGNSEYVNYMESTDIDKTRKRYQEIFKNVEAQKETTGLTQEFINEVGLKSMYLRALIPGVGVAGGISTSTTKEYTTIAKGFDEIWAIYEKGGEKAIDRVWMDLTDKGIRYSKSEVLQMLQDYEKQVKDIGKNAMEVRNLMAGLSGDRLQKIQSTSALFDNSAFAITDKDDKAEQERKKIAKEQYNGIVADIIKNTEGWTNETDIGLAITEMINKQLESGEIKDETVINQLIKLREEVESELPRVSSFTWSGILDNVENYASDLQKVNKALIELNDTGAITSSTFSDLASVMDSLDLSAVYESFSNRDEGLNYIHALTESMKNLNVQYDANTGMLKVNAESLEFLQDAQERQAKGKIKSMINDLYATKASVESQIAYIDAQIAAVEQMEKAIVNLGDGNITEKELMSQADNAYTVSLSESMQTIDSNYEKLTESSLQWAKASIFQISEVTDAWDKYWQAVRGGAVNAGELRKTAEGLTSNYTKQMFDTSGIDLSKYEGVKANSAKGKELIQKLQDYRIGLTEAREEYAKTLSLYDGQIAMLESLYNSDLSKWGNEKDGDSSKLQKYIGQLKEIYNILNRIQMLEHRLSTLDTYADIAKGKDYGELLQQRLGYNDELLDQYKFLVSEQKQFTNGYKDFIQSVDGLEGVFDFDQFGQIIINWEKYNSLQDEAIEGEISLKEKADDVYNTYTSMMSELQGYFDKYISYLKNTLNLLNEMKDNYVDLESKAAAAVQEIYKKELDAKLEAIDKEMKALEELTQARQKANKERDNAKALSGYQADLQRAMMDTSGASDSNYIKAQQNISDKLDAMAEDKYSEMINDIKKQLEEEKDVLQKNFDELFENQEWLYDFLDRDLMSDKTQLYQLLQGTDEWAKKSPTEKWQDMKDWDTKFFSYAENGIFGKEGIKGILDDIDAKETEYKNLDEALKNQDSKGDVNITNTIADWGQRVANAASSSGNGGNNYNSSPVAFNNDKAYGGSPNTYTKASIGAYNVPINTDVKYGTFSTVSDDGVLYQPDNYKNVKLKSTGKKALDAGIQFNSSGMDVSTQNIWKAGSKWLIWNGTKGIYEEAKDLFNKYGNMKLAEAINYCRDRGFFVELFEAAGARGLSKFASGGFANFTGPAWLDGTPSAPEAVLDALQTKHFIDFTNTLDKMYSNIGQAGVSNASNVTIDNISFNVESMSSPEDGEKAFNAFVDKFKEIGDRTGLKVQTFKNTL